MSVARVKSASEVLHDFCVWAYLDFDTLPVEVRRAISETSCCLTIARIKKVKDALNAGLSTEEAVKMVKALDTEELYLRRVRGTSAYDCREEARHGQK